MTYTLINITDGNYTKNQIDDIILFCREIQSNTNSNADTNMVADDYEAKTNSLLYTLLIEKRFSNNRGIFNLLYLDKKLISLSGAYKSDFDSRAVIGGVRTYTLDQYRNQFHHSEQILPAQISWARTQNAEVFCLTFNLYNEWLAKFIERANSGRGIVLGKPVPESLVGFQRHPKIVKIKETKQILLKKYLINNYTVNFSEIEIE